MSDSSVNLLDRLRQVHEALEASGFDHALGGAIALSFHAQPRATIDIDLNVMASGDQIGVLLEVLAKVVVVPADAEAALHNDGQFRFHWQDRKTPLDVFLPQHETFHQLLSDRAEFQAIGDVVIKVVSATDLTILKMLFDRPKDWVDIQSMLDYGTPNLSEVRRWIGELVGEDDHRLDRLDELVEGIAGPRRDQLGDVL